MATWKLLDEIVRIRSKWMTLIGESWVCENGLRHEYWRIEKVDSIIVLPIQTGHIFCTSPTFRVGIQRNTLDFPGGRLPKDKHPKEILPIILHRELGVPANAIDNIIRLNKEKWIINSSFSNQGLLAYVAEINNAFSIPEPHIGTKVTANASGVSELLSKLDCLQCRMVLLEWLIHSKQ